jgi:MHS family citrate/tricarballylate:H+ symporter-like MFS transporter
MHAASGTTQPAHSVLEPRREQRHAAPIASMPPVSPTRAKIRTVIRVTSGNFLEMFDFFLFGLYAPNIAKAFFPARSEFASLMLTFGTFGAGFLMRPLGALVLGAYIDRVGRRRGLIRTLQIMACGTVLIAFVPGYDRIGICAPLLVLTGRLLQGFSAGVELGGVSVYLSEIATPGHAGFYVSWQSASQQLAIVVAAALGAAVNFALPPESVSAWGWRIPFFVGCAIVPFIFVIRRSLEETEAFMARTQRLDSRAIFASMLTHRATVLTGMLLVVMTTVSFYLITVYTPTFGKRVLALSSSDSLLVTSCVGASNFFWLPLMGALSDRIGRRPLLLTFSVLTVLTAYPALAFLVAAPSLGRMLVVELYLSLLYAGYNGAMVVTLTEIMPISVRTAGFSLAYSLATALFGGFTPAVSTWLIELTRDKAAPSYWMMGAAVCGLVATLMVSARANDQTARAEVDGAARAHDPAAHQ